MTSISNLSTTEASASPASPPSPTAVPDASGVISVTDTRGREIKARLLRPFDRMRLFKALGGELASNAPYFGYAVIAASVTEIAGDLISTPTTTLQIEALVTRLDDAGLNAVSAGLASLMSTAESSTAAEAKNF